MQEDAVRRFAADGMLIVGGGAAILLQLANPVVAAGVARHSDFASRPMHRLRNTLTFVYAVVLGTPDEARLVAGFVDRAHAPVAGAMDAAHQLWVASTLYDTAVRVHERLDGPLGSADAIYREYERLGTALQVPPGAWPRDRAAFRHYWSEQLAIASIGDDARATADALLHPRTGPLWLRAGMPLARLLTASLLPDEIRRAYGLPWSAARARRAAAGWAFLRAIARITPRRLREWPSRHYLAGLRAR